MSYMGDDIVELAKQSMEYPPDFGWYGRDDMFETWGFSAIAYHRDSGLRDQSNYIVASKELTEKYPEDIEEISMGHWAVGHVNTMIVKVIKDDAVDKHWDEIDEDDITDAFKNCMEIADYIRHNYPVLDDMHYSEMQYEAALNNIWNEMPGECDISREELDLVYDKLHEIHDYREDCDDQGEWYHSDEIYEACFMMGRISEYDPDRLSDELIDEFHKWIYAVEREEFEKTQGVLFDES